MRPAPELAKNCILVLDETESVIPLTGNVGLPYLIGSRGPLYDRRAALDSLTGSTHTETAFLSNDPHYLLQLLPLDSVANRNEYWLFRDMPALRDFDRWLEQQFKITFDPLAFTYRQVYGRRYSAEYVSKDDNGNFVRQRTSLGRIIRKVIGFRVPEIGQSFLQRTVQDNQWEVCSVTRATTVSKLVVVLEKARTPPAARTRRNTAHAE